MAVLVASDRLLGKIVSTAWKVFWGGKEALESSKYNQRDVNGWVGHCMGQGSAGAGHCGFFDPNLRFHDVNNFVVWPSHARAPVPKE